MRIIDGIHQKIQTAANTIKGDKPEAGQKLCGKQNSADFLLFEVKQAPIDKPRSFNAFNIVVVLAAPKSKSVTSGNILMTF